MVSRSSAIVVMLFAARLSSYKACNLISRKREEGRTEILLWAKFNSFNGCGDDVVDDELVLISLKSFSSLGGRRGC